MSLFDTSAQTIAQIEVQLDDLGDSLTTALDDTSTQLSGQLSALGTALAPAGEIRAFKRSAVPAGWTIAMDPAPNFTYSGITNGVCIFNDALRQPAGVPSSRAVVHSKPNGDLVAYYFPIATSASPQTIYKHNLTSGVLTTLAAEQPGTPGSGWIVDNSRNAVDGKAYFLSSGSATAAVFFRFDPVIETVEVLSTPAAITTIPSYIDQDKDGNVYVIFLGSSTSFRRWNYATNTWTILPVLPASSTFNGRILCIDGKVIYQTTSTTPTYYVYDSVAVSWSASKAYASDVPNMTLLSYTFSNATIVAPNGSSTAPHTRWTLDASSNLAIQDITGTNFPGPAVTSPLARAFGTQDPVTGVRPGLFITVATSGVSAANIRHTNALSLGDPVVLAMKN